MEAIKPAIECSGFEPNRIDQAPHNERIDVKIMADIKESRFVVADVTEQKAGVYFEAGYAMGMGIPVIWSVSQSDLGNVHFDTRQYCHIVWESKEDFRKSSRILYLQSLGGVVGLCSHAPLLPFLRGFLSLQCCVCW